MLKGSARGRRGALHMGHCTWPACVSIVSHSPHTACLHTSHATLVGASPAAGGCGLGLKHTGQVSSSSSSSSLEAAASSEVVILRVLLTLLHYRLQD